MSDVDLFGPDKDELRARLPITVVARYLADHGAPGPHILADGTALCPFHHDRQESFYLWEGDDGIIRWWCQPCGFGGDIFDLIQRTLSCTFPMAIEEAQKILASLPPGYVAPAAVPREQRPQADDWMNRVDVARSRAVEKDGLLALRLGFVTNEDTQALAHQWDLYLRTSWGWGLDPDTNAILMPHWDAAGALTGCKVRSGTQKESLPGSKYIALYGAWLGRRYRDVLLTEGESDCVFAGFQAALEGIPLDVFALPSGAGRPPTQEQLDFLGRGGTVYLAFDPDRAGVAATRKWIDALVGYGHSDIRICALPHLRDLRAARPTIAHLLAHAKKPLEIPSDIAQAPGGYMRPTQQGGIRSITSWWVEPLARLVGGDDPGYDAILHTRATSTRIVLRLSDLASVQSLNKWANRNELIFTGSDSDRKVIAEFIEAQGAIVPEVFQTEQVGVHLPPEEYHFAGATVVYPTDYAGDLPWRYAPTGKSASDVTGRVLLPIDHNAEAFQWEWLSAFIALSDPSVTHPLIAWLVASARRHEVQNFPLLFLGGSSGVGKSTLATLALRLLGSDITVDLAAVTPFALAKTLAATTTIPVFVDEWTRLSRRDSREAFQGAIPNIYTGGLMERGQVDLTTQTYRVTAPTIIAGEDTFELDRERDRTVVLYPSRKFQNRDALNVIKHKPLEGFARNLHTFLLTNPDIPALDYAPTGTRPMYNEMILQAGWATLRSLVSEALTNGEEDAPDLPIEPDLSCMRRAGTPEEQENVYEAALKAGLSIRDANGNPVVWVDGEGRGTWVRAKELVGLIESRRIDIQLPGRSRAMLAYFRERFPEIEHHDGVQAPGSVSPLHAALIHDLHLQVPIEGGNVV